MDYSTRFFDLPRLRMHAAVAGPEAGPLLILLHGFPEFYFSWRRQFAPLAAAGFRVVAPDQRGYNLTDKTPPYDLHTLSQDSVDLIQACGRETAYVAGHDWGAAVAWFLAEQHPERVTRLAILNVPHPRVLARNLLGGNWRQRARSWYIGYFQIPWLPERQLVLNNCWALKQALVRTARPGTFPPADLAQYVAAWLQPGAVPAMLGWYRSMAHLAGSRRGAPRPGPIAAPTLIIWGEQDVALGMELAEQSLACTANGRLVRLPNATHWVHQDEPAAVTHLLLEHFTG